MATAQPPGVVRQALNCGIGTPVLNMNAISNASFNSEGRPKEIICEYDEKADSLNFKNISVTPAGLMVDGVPARNCLPFDQIKKGKVIGRGRFATVVKAKWPRYSQRVMMALKCYGKAESGQEETAGEVENDIHALLHPVDHPNVLKYINIFCVRRTIYVLMEYANMGSLMDLVERCGPLSAELNVSIARQVLYGLQALHNAGFIHRHLKPSDILFNSDGCVKIANFSVAKHCAAMCPQDSTTFLDWRSFTPEQIRGERQDINVDSFSFGSVMGYCAFGVNPLVSKREVVAQLDTLRHQQLEILRHQQENSAATTRKSLWERLAADADEETVPRVSAPMDTIVNMRTNVPLAIDLQFLSDMRLRCFGPTPPVVVPKPMQTLIEKCLSGDPTQRPSCAEMLQDELFGGPQQEHTPTEDEYRGKSQAQVRQWFQPIGHVDLWDFGEPLPPEDAVQLLLSSLNLSRCCC